MPDSPIKQIPQAIDADTNSASTICLSKSVDAQAHDNSLNTLIQSSDSLAAWITHMDRFFPNQLEQAMIYKDQYGNTALSLAGKQGKQQIAEELLNYLESKPLYLIQWLLDDVAHNQAAIVEWMITIKSPLIARVLAFMQTCTPELQQTFLRTSRNGLSLLHIAIMDQFAVENVLNAFVHMRAHHLLAMFDPSGRCPILWLIDHYQPQYHQALSQFFSESDSQYWGIQDAEGNTVLQKLAYKTLAYPELGEMIKTALQRLSQDQSASALAYKLNTSHIVDYENFSGTRLSEMLSINLTECMPLLIQVQANDQVYRQQKKHDHQFRKNHIKRFDKQSADEHHYAELHEFFLNNSSALSSHEQTNLQLCSMYSSPSSNSSQQSDKGTEDSPTSIVRQSW